MSQDKPETDNSAPTNPPETATEPDLENPAPSAYANYQPSQQALNALQRGTRYSRDLACEILGDIAAGASLARACQNHEVHPVTFYRWMNAQTQNVGEDEASWLSNEYAHARMLRGEYYGDKVGEIADLAVKGDVDPRAAKAALDGYQWTAARMSPHSWGDVQRHEHQVSGHVQHEHGPTSSLMAQLRGESGDTSGRKQIESQSREPGQDSGPDQGGSGEDSGDGAENPG